LQLYLSFLTCEKKDSKKRSKWMNPEQCKLFFDEYALQHGFDPLDALNWQSFNLNKLKQAKAAFSLVYLIPMQHAYSFP